MSKLEAQVISKDDLSEMGQMRGEMSAKIDTVSSDVRVTNWQALRWRHLDWALLPHTTRKAHCPSSRWRTA